MAAAAATQREKRRETASSPARPPPPPLRRLPKNTRADRRRDCRRRSDIGWRRPEPAAVAGWGATTVPCEFAATVWRKQSNQRWWINGADLSHLRDSTEAGRYRGYPDRLARAVIVSCTLHVLSRYRGQPRQPQNDDDSLK